MFNRKILLFVSAFSFWALGARADVACVKQDCATLGYTKTLAQCSGADNIIKCPFDTSKVACNTPVTISTPIFDILYNWVFNVCDIERSLSADISCLTDGYDQEMLCADLTGLDLNMDPSSCLNSSEADPASISTMQDLLDAVENILIAKVDPCAGATEYDPNLQTCSNTCTPADPTSGKHYCSSTPQTISCSTAIANAGGIELNSSTSLVSGKEYYLTNNVTISSISGKRGTFYFSKANALPPCANTYSVNANPTLTINDLIIPEGGNGSTVFNGFFRVKTVINNLGYMNSDSPASLTFFEDGTIKQAELTSDGYTSLSIDVPTMGKTIKVKFLCTYDSGYTCNAQFMGDTETYLEYCNMDYDINLSCDGNCTKVSCSSF